jgi:predicted flap endonuclease-1-like 5' DNA nuclease
MTTKELTLTLSAELYDAVVGEARERDVPVRRLVRTFIEDALAHRLAGPKTVEETLLDRFLAGPDDKAWAEMYELLGQMPEEMAASPRVRRRYAFALNRDGRGEEAERVLEQLIAQEGPSPEVCGLLGRVYKDRWDAGERQPEVLDQAVEAYLQGHDSGPANPYPGINALTMMTFYPEPPARCASLLEEVADAVRALTDGGEQSYWHHATRIELAVHQDDAAEARAALTAALTAYQVPWMIESTLRNLRLLREAREARGMRVRTWVPVAMSALDWAMGAVPDDLTKIEGIGPKIAALLQAAGITTHARLATVDVERLRTILRGGGRRFVLADPETWPLQASLAAAGRWDVLKALQDELVGGRRVD